MPDLMTALPMIVLILAIGALAGVLAGLLGVGGGIVLVPAFLFAFSVLGYDSPHLMQICLGTSLATIIVTSLRSGLAHHKRGALDLDLLKTWGPGIVLGSVAGVIVATRLGSNVLQAIFGGLASLVGLYLALGRDDWKLGEAPPKGAVRIGASGMIGFLSVLLGIGGGAFGVSTLTMFGVAMHRAVATAAGFGVIIAVPSVIGFLWADVPVAPPFTIGAVNLVAFFLVIAMTLITVPWGAALAHRMDPKPLKRVFGVFLIVVGMNMLRKVLFA